MNIFELAKETESEASAIKFAIKIGLINLKPRLCEKCNCKMVVEKGKKRHGIDGRYRCINRQCRASSSLLKGSIFESCHLPISVLIRIIYFYAMGFKVTDCALHVNVQLKTAIRWYRIFRRVCESYQMSKIGFKIGGEGYNVEVDETYVCKRKYNRGRVLVAQSVWLVGGICRETGEIFLKFVTRRDSASLLGIITSSVASGTRIITDCWRGYLNLAANGYYHATVNHSYHFVSPDDPTVHTQRVERLWRSIKNFIPRNARREFLESYGSAFAVQRLIGEEGKLKKFENFIDIIKLFFAYFFIFFKFLFWLHH